MRNRFLTPSLTRGEAVCVERLTVRGALACLLLLVGGWSTSGAQQRPASDSAARDGAASDTAEAAPAAPGSPRAALEEFFRLTRTGRYGEAARYLDVPAARGVDPPLLARQLKAVLDRSLWIDLDRVSGAAVGDTADGLPRSIEELGTLVGSDGIRVAVRLTRTGSREVPWRFARATVQRIPSLYATLPDRWMLERLPGALLRPGPLELLWWQWLALPVLLLVASMVGWVLSRLLRASFTRISARTTTTWDDVVLQRLGAPLTAALTLVAFAVALPWLSLYEPARRTTLRVVQVAGYVILFWSLWRLIDVGRQLLARSAWAHASRSSRALLPLAGRIAKVGVVAVAAVTVLSMLGYPVASLVAGLGLGGLALALAAQKTVENLFGAFSIGVDQPFREGDFVRIEDFVGTVESIGLRSTRFRTLDRTIITIPNGKLAEMRLESLAVRDRLRLAMVVGLAQDTTADQLREVVDGFERVLRAAPKLWPDDLTVRFIALGAASFDIEVAAWFQTTDWAEFLRIRQDVLLQFMDVVERAGTSFARPTRTIHIGSAPPFAIEGAPMAGTDAGR